MAQLHNSLHIKLSACDPDPHISLSVETSLWLCQPPIELMLIEIVVCVLIMESFDSLSQLIDFRSDNLVSHAVSVHFLMNTRFN